MSVIRLMPALGVRNAGKPKRRKPWHGDRGHGYCTNAKRVYPDGLVAHVKWMAQFVTPKEISSDLEVPASWVVQVHTEVIRGRVVPRYMFVDIDLGQPGLWGCS